ncbi:hypothetical protein SVAN01_07807 [Stagonosporopsis vannaccii]|nr:hypothetical protein SVAN01_07807 [Stagonosporopsis vannaccii]
MSMHAFDADNSQSGLCRDEEDLVDNDDSDIEIGVETREYAKSPVLVQPEDVSYTGKPAQKHTPDNDKQNLSSDSRSLPPVTTRSSVAKTPQAAILIKTIGAAKVKVCKYGAECHNANCNFDHAGADRRVKIANGKHEKLCSMINTENGCQKGDSCWFSHEAVGVACSNGELRTTCPKGSRCFYKHSDDKVVASVEAVDSASVQADLAVDVDSEETAAEAPLSTLTAARTLRPQEIEALAQPSASKETPHLKIALLFQQDSTLELKKAGRKRGCSEREVTGGTEDTTQKINIMYENTALGSMFAHRDPVIVVEAMAVIEARAAGVAERVDAVTAIAHLGQGSNTTGREGAISRRINRD